MIKISDSVARWASFAVGLAIGFLLLLSHSERPAVTPASSTQWSTQLATSFHGPDRLADYKKSRSCNASSPTLHDAHAPRCTTRAGLLRAMSSGGRRGWDKPYHPRGCDMQFFSFSEVCQILGKFDHVYIIGDRMMRLLAQALIMLVRHDLINGARVTWTERIDNLGCDCRGLFERPECEMLGVVNSAAVQAGHPESIQCLGNLGAISFIKAESYPLMQDDLEIALSQIQEPVSRNGRDAFILGHGLLNDFETGETLSWVEQLEDVLSSKVPGLYAGSDLPDSESASRKTGGAVPRLFITPNAQGTLKYDEYLRVQNNIRLMRFTHGITPLVESRGYEVLQMYNYSCQATTPDGVYGSYEQNIMKAMMVLNWLNAIDV